MRRPCVTYPRVSQKRQQVEGNSIEAQRELFQAHAEKHNLVILHEYVEAHSAKSAGRPQFNKMLEYVKANPDTVILVEKTDRLTRNYRDAADIEDLVDEYGIEIHLVKEHRVLKRDNNYFDKQMSGLNVFMAKMYVENLKEESKKGTRIHLKNGGYHTNAPYGYLNGKIGKLKALVPDPERAPYIKHLYHLFAQGTYSIESVAERMVQDGYYFNNWRKRAPKATLHRFLENPIYKGDVIYKGVTYKGAHEPLVTAKLFDQVQLIKNKGSKANGDYSHAFLWRGLVHCGNCGRLLSAELKKGKYIYYRCTRRKSECAEGAIKEEVLQQVFKETVLSLAPKVIKIRPLLIQAIKEMLPDIADESEEKAERLNRCIIQARRILDNAEYKWLDGKISDERWSQLAADKTAEIRKMEHELAEITDERLDFYEIAREILELPKMLSLCWDELNFDEKQTVINATTSNWKVKGGKATLKLKEPFSGLLAFSKFGEWRAGRDELRTFLIEGYRTCELLGGLAS